MRNDFNRLWDEELKKDLNYIIAKTRKELKFLTGKKFYSPVAVDLLVFIFIM